MRLCTLLAGGGADLGCLLGLGAGADGLDGILAGAVCGDSPLEDKSSN